MQYTKLYSRHVLSMSSCSERGMTLVEVLVAAMVLLPLMTVIMQNFVRCVQMNELAREMSAVVWGERTRIAAIQRTAFSQVLSTFHNQTFSISGVNGIGITYVEATQPDLLTVHVSYTWRDREGRLTGEDLDLDGQLDAGEDKNGNGRLDSQAGFSTQIYRL